MKFTPYFVYNNPSVIAIDNSSTLTDLLVSTPTFPAGYIKNGMHGRVIWSGEFKTKAAPIGTTTLSLRVYDGTNTATATLTDIFPADVYLSEITFEGFFSVTQLASTNYFSSMFKVSIISAGSPGATTVYVSPLQLQSTTLSTAAFSITPRFQFATADVSNELWVYAATLEIMNNDS